jgi:hypothetical protein
MGLISKEVEVVLHPNTIKYYENLGYEIPRRKDDRNKMRVPMGTKIIVSVDHLSNKSGARVNIQCDNCGKELKNIRWVDYLFCVKEDNKYYCNNCSIQIFNGNNIKKTRLKNGKSFEQWCIDNNHQDVLDRWDYKLNNKNPCEINYGTNDRYYFKCPRGLHKSELKNINLFTSREGSIKCKACNSFAQWGIDNICDDFLEKYWDYEKNIVNPWIIASQYNKNVWIKCQETDCHGSYDIRPNSFVNNHRCPECNSSKGEKKISDLLNINKFQKLEQEEYDLLINDDKKYYIPQKKFDDLIGLGGGLLSYDFYLPNQQYNFLIEYDGEFHYKPIRNYKNEPIKYAEERLRKQQIHDEMKNEYCKKRNIKLLRIPYWEFNNIETILFSFIKKEGG